MTTVTISKPTVEDNEIENFLRAQYQMSPLPKFLTVKEIMYIMKKELTPKQAPGYNLFTARFIK